VERIKASGAGLAVMVDCGIGAVREAQQARSLGLDLIITDHHEINGLNRSNSLNVIPSRCLRDPCPLFAAGYPEFIREQVSGLTGVGVAFKLVRRFSAWTLLMTV
jgi:single-stranded-DNA-specific exonuclease